jgi:hypothetical protein
VRIVIWVCVEGAFGPKPEHYTRDNVRHQLEQYERYGVLSVMALGCNKDVLYSWQEEQRRGELDGADIFTADRGFGVYRGIWISLAGASLGPHPHLRLGSPRVAQPYNSVLPPKKREQPARADNCRQRRRDKEESFMMSRFAFSLL